MILQRYINEKTVFFTSLVLLIIVLSMPYTIRTLNNNNTLIDSFSYYHARIAKEVLEKGVLPDYDNLLFGGRAYIFNPYHLFIAFFAKFVGIEFVSKFIPFLLGIFSFLVFYLILKNLKIKLLNRFLIIIVLVLSPVYMYTFSISNPYSLIILLNLLGLYFFLKSKRVFFVLSALFFLSTVFFEPINTLIVLLLLLSYSLYERKKIRYFIILLIILLTAYISYYTLFCLNYGFPIGNEFIKKNFFESSVTDLGALNGFSIFAIFSSLVGLYISWRNKSRFVFIYITILLLLGLSYFTINSNYYLNFFLSVFAGLFFYRIIIMKWEISWIRNLTILFLLYGLLFSIVSYTPRLSMALPNNDIADGLSWLRYNSKEEVIFSDYKNGFWIEYFSGQPVILDPLVYNKSRLDDSRFILNSRSLKETKLLLNKYNVSYIYIDNTLRQSIGENKGLLFLLRNNETFKMVYNNSYTQIYELKGD